ncbi:hypothetical protein [Desulfosporosinus sp. FKB]|nr:hypothetical protein [Desulfosporosinus sp. FKB]
MADEHISIKEMWVNYLISIGEEIVGTNKNYTSWHFVTMRKVLMF